MFITQFFILQTLTHLCLVWSRHLADNFPCYSLPHSPLQHCHRLKHQPGTLEDEIHCNISNIIHLTCSANISSSQWQLTTHIQKISTYQERPLFLLQHEGMIEASESVEGFLDFWKRPKCLWCQHLGILYRYEDCWMRIAGHWLLAKW